MIVNEKKHLEKRVVQLQSLSTRVQDLESELAGAHRTIREFQGQSAIY